MVLVEIIMPKRSFIDGDNALYHYFSTDLVAKESPENHALIMRMITDLSIWFPQKVYQKMPVLLPFVVRDPTCRKAVNKRQEEWGSCNDQGYFRDDNTLIKAIPRKFLIKSKRKAYSGKRMGKGFIASHVWRKTRGGTLASRDPLLNSFVPNLVWLPRQISKLTDREGSFAQRFLQKLSLSMFRDVVVPGSLAEYTDRVWEMLPVPSGVDTPEASSGNSFDVNEKDVSRLVEKIAEQSSVLRSHQPNKKIYCSRYLASYSKLPSEKRVALQKNLENYLSLLS